MNQNRIYRDGMLELRKLSVDFIKEFFSPDDRSLGKLKRAMIPVSGGIDSITTTYLLVEALGKERVVAFHLPNGNTPQTDTENFDLAMSLLGIEYHKQNISSKVEELVRMIPPFENMGPNQHEFCRAEVPVSYYVREAMIYAYGKSQEGLYRGVGALDRAEFLTGNYPKHTCTLDVAPIVGMYRQQIRGLAVLLGVPESIVYQTAENDADPECLPIDRLFEKGEIALDLFLFLIHEKGFSDSEIHSLGKEYGVEFNQGELDFTRRLIRNSEHKRNPEVLYPEVPFLGIDERNLTAAYREGEMIYDLV